METDAGDRPGTPGESDRAFEKRMDELPGDMIVITAIRLAWHAAVAWATRREREECVARLREIAHVERIPTHLTPRQVINLVADALDESGLIRSDTDAPEEADRGQ